MSNPMTTISNGLKLAGEALLPGASLLMDGQLKNGAAHAVVGVGARVFLGPVGVVVVAANSYSKSVSDRHIWDYISHWTKNTSEATKETFADLDEPSEVEVAPVAAKKKAKA